MPPAPDHLVLLASRNHRATTRSLRVRGLDPTTVDEVRRRVVRGKVIEDCVNLLPGRVFLGEMDASRLAEGCILPGDGYDLFRELGVREELRLPRAEIVKWSARVEGEPARLAALETARASIRVSVGEPVVVFMPGGARWEGVVMAVGNRYAHVRIDASGRIVRVPHGLVAPRSADAIEGRDAKPARGRQRRRRARNRAGKL